MKKENNICLLMTGCITPGKDVYALQVKDTDVRREQYLSALKFYIEKTKIKKIIFCDNSNAEEIKEIAELALKKKKDFEWISFQGNLQKTAKYGKGYGEGEIIKYACENSKLIKTCKSFAKVTGRLKITNLSLISKVAQKDKNYINIFVDNTNRFFADTRFFIMKIEDFQNYLIHVYEKVNDQQGEPIEVCFARKIINSEMPYKIFPTYIGYEGVSGSTGLRYTINLNEKIYLFAKIFSRYLFSKDGIYDSMEIYQMGMIYDDNMWREKFSQLSNENVVIYGAGLVGIRLYKLCIKHCNVVMWIDKDYKNIKKRCGKKIEAQEKIRTHKADYIIIATKKLDFFQEIKDVLKEYGIKTEILWFDGNSLKICM